METFFSGAFVVLWNLIHLEDNVLVYYVLSSFTMQLGMGWK